MLQSINEILQFMVESLPTFLFWIFAAVTALCAILVVVSQNIVRSATWLLFTLGGVSAIFFLLGADFVGATQLLVYVGGTLVLVIFGVMLTAQGPFINMKSSPAEWAISAIVGLLLLSVLVLSILSESEHPTKGKVRDYAPEHRLVQIKKSDDGAATSQYADAIGLAFVGVGVGPAHETLESRATRAKDPRRDVGVVRMNYLLPFEIVSVHLLVVLIGAAYLARAKRRARVIKTGG
jgi:NADH-quinone oxidoreductase subunit J